MTLPYSVEKKVEQTIFQAFRQPKIITFSDINSGFSFSNNSKLIVEDVAAINNQITNILSTQIGSRPFEPTYGSDLYDLLFDPIDDLTAWKIETASFDALATWMPRIRVLYPLCRVEPLNTNDGYNVRLPYQVKIKNIYGEYKARVTQ
jgi:phage baseplate assembly protein W